MAGWSRIAAGALALAAGLAACGGSGGTGGTPKGSPSQQQPNQVEIRNIAFRPAQVTVAAGTVVTWTNKEDLPHTVTAGKPDDAPSGEFDAPLETNGSTFTFSFSKAGTFAYYCKVHPQMTGTVTVT